MLTVFSKENCIYCKKTNIFLHGLNIDFEEIKLDPGIKEDKKMIEYLKDKYNCHVIAAIPQELHPLIREIEGINEYFDNINLLTINSPYDPYRHLHY